MGMLGRASITEIEIAHAVKNSVGDEHHPSNGDDGIEAFFYLRDTSYLDHLPEPPAPQWMIYANQTGPPNDQPFCYDDALADLRERQIPSSGATVSRVPGNLAPSRPFA